MKADEAKRLARTSLKREERARAKEAAAERTKEGAAAHKAAARMIPEIQQEIRDTAARGFFRHYSSHSFLGAGWALQIVAEHFRALGYQVERGHDAREMGDMEAPCLEYYDFIDISWA